MVTVRTLSDELLVKVFGYLSPVVSYLVCCFVVCCFVVFCFVDFFVDLFVHHFVVKVGFVVLLMFLPPNKMDTKVMRRYLMMKIFSTKPMIHSATI